MTGTDAPRTVRLAAILTMAVAPFGLLLLIDGLLELARAKEESLKERQAES